MTPDFLQLQAHRTKKLVVLNQKHDSFVILLKIAFQKYHAETLAWTANP